jgi:hypothetical protein
MSLYDELKRPWRAPRLVIPERSRIEAAAKEIEDLFKGLPTDPEPPRDYLDEAERLLIAGNGTLDRLKRRHLKALPWILWSSDRRWSENRQLVTDYLDWADQEWRTSPKRLWRHYVLNLNPESYAIQVIGLWLQDRLDHLSDALREVSVQLRLFEPEIAIELTAHALIDGRDVAGEFDRLKLARGDLLKSSFMLHVLSKVGEALKKNRPKQTGTVGALRRLLNELGEQPLSAMHGSTQAQRHTATMLVEGVIEYTSALNMACPKEAVELLNLIIGHPRVNSNRWALIDSKARERAIKWFAVCSVNCYFDVMNRMQISKKEMVIERRVFWMRYQHALSDAWLVVGSRIADTANKVECPFGKFAGHTNPDHLGIMMRIGGLVIFEMSHDGRTWCWPWNDSAMPGFYGDSYELDFIRSKCDAKYDASFPRFWMTHQGNWIDRYEQQIFYRANVLPRQICGTK